MDINQVIYLGNQIKEPFMSPDIYKMVMILGAVVIFLGLLMAMSDEIGMVILGLGVLALIVGAVGYNVDDSEEKYNESINKWKSEIVQPYINSLPKEKGEVVYIKIEPELQVNTNIYGWNAYTTEVKRTPLTTSFKEDTKITTLTNWYDTNMNLTSEDKPYVEYQKLEVNLGYGIDAGYYNLTVNLPENYTFTDIK